MLTVLPSYPVPGLDPGSGEPLGSCALLQKVPMPEKIFSSRVYYLYLRLIFTLYASGCEVGGALHSCPHPSLSVDEVEGKEWVSLLPLQLLHQLEEGECHNGCGHFSHEKTQKGRSMT